ncbi:MAG: 1-phosphofructokinase [Erysipelotrichaceae bacterium]|nr:1-phosphofructokinase [Erysipelotrichaceae bacterium]
MIYTVTLNPALDYTIKVDHLSLGKINRTKEEHLFAGGKGINVSCVLNELGIKSCALGFIADFTGQQLRSSLEKQGILTNFIVVDKGMTRINIKIKSDEESEINGMGPVIQDMDFEKLCLQIDRLNEDDILVLSGSIPSCMPADTYEIMMRRIQDKHVRIIVDAEKKLLLNVLKYHPFLIKPNKEELKEMFHAEINDDEDVIFYARKLQELGVRNVLVSMASEGSLLVDESGQVYRMGIAKGTLLNSVGAGDSMVAGFLAGWLRTNDFNKALLLATACGGATAFSHGLAHRSLIDEILHQLSTSTTITTGGLLK